MTISIHGSLKSLVSGPATEPISIAEAKSHLRVDGPDEDLAISNLITEARQYCERLTNRAFGVQTWDMWTDRFHPAVEVPKPPLSSVTSVTYTDTDGNSQTATGSIYTVDADSIPGRVYLAYNQSWPSTQSIPKAVKIRYVAGSSTTPGPVKRAMLLLIGHWYNNREDQIIGTVATSIDHAARNLLAPYIVY